jgi:adiponectin receptor
MRNRTTVHKTAPSESHERHHKVESTTPLLCHWDDLPDWQKDNHYITSGYVRETLSFRKCFHSLVYIHNETGNIYSHLIPSLMSLISIFLAVDYLVPRFPTTSWADHAALICFATGCVACLGMSGLYHCLKCHSIKVAGFGNKLDYLGIVILIEASMISMIYYGLFEDTTLRLVFWALTSGLGVVCAIISLADKFRTPDWRPFRAAMFVAYGLSGILPIFAGIYIYGVSGPI